ncbi:MAG: response regulator [Cyanobacteriota bacterium]|nr:response regulator [Cyanobacteriota bacterium]
MMTSAPNRNEAFFSQLNLYSQQQFTGRLDIKVVTGQQWSLYLSLGHLVWGSEGVHPVRRFRRQLTSFLPNVKLKAVAPRQSDRFECWDYHVLALLVQRNRAQTDEVVSIMRGLVAEVLFDLLQAIEIASVTQQIAQFYEKPTRVGETSEEIRTAPTFKIKPKLGARPSSTDLGILPRSRTWQVNSALNATQKIWERWSQMGLALYSPNLAPVIKKPELLQAKTSAGVYKNLSALIDGKRTLRDVSIFLKKDRLSVTKSLMPYIRQQLIGLVEVPDLANPYLPHCPIKPAAPAKKTPPSKTVKSCVVCIDDSPRVCKAMEKLIVGAGYQFIGISEAIQALPTLLQHKPDVIFLDLMMPIANGYEICSQIRRVSKFKDTPVIILTSQDGLVDRVRAKVVGATDFMTKPVDRKKVLEVVRKYRDREGEEALSVRSSAPELENSRREKS